MSFTISPNADMVLDCADRVEAVETAAALGLDAVEFWDVESADDPEALRAACDEHDVTVAASTTVGVSANTQGTGPGISDPSLHDQAVDDIRRSLELGEAVGVDALIVTVGPEQNDLPPGAEHRAIVDVLRDAAPTAESAGIDLVVEPLNNPVDHQGYYLDSSYEAYEIVDAVDSPAVSVLFDIYHQQISEGNVIENIEAHSEFIGYFHVADVPGRHEPGTGELNYERIFEAIDDTDFDGYVGLEYAPTGDPAASIEHVQDLLP